MKTLRSVSNGYRVYQDSVSTEVYVNRARISSKVDLFVIL